MNKHYEQALETYWNKFSGIAPNSIKRCSEIRAKRAEYFSWLFCILDRLIILSAPDYHRSFYEGHYLVFWLPAMPKSVAKLYLKLRGRTNLDYIDSIYYITRSSVKKWLSKHQVSVANLAEITIPLQIQYPELMRNSKHRKFIQFLKRSTLGKRFLSLLVSVLVSVRKYYGGFTYLVTKESA